MHLASYTIRGRSSYGAVVGDGVVDLRLRFGARHASLVDVLRAHALDEARASLEGVRPDYALAEVELLPPLLAPEKISFRNYTPATGCLWVAQLKGEKFVAVPGTPICSQLVKFNG